MTRDEALIANNNGVQRFQAIKLVERKHHHDNNNKRSEDCYASHRIYLSVYAPKFTNLCFCIEINIKYKLASCPFFSPRPFITLFFYFSL